MQAKVHSVFKEKLCENYTCGRPQAVLAISPCVMTQAVLAIPEMKAIRFWFAQADCFKTSTDINAHTD